MIIWIAFKMEMINLLIKSDWKFSEILWIRNHLRNFPFIKTIVLQKSLKQKGRDKKKNIADVAFKKVDDHFASTDGLNPSIPHVPFLYPLKTSEN